MFLCVSGWQGACPPVKALHTSAWVPCCHEHTRKRIYQLPSKALWSQTLLACCVMMWMRGGSDVARLVQVQRCSLETPKMGDRGGQKRKLEELAKGLGDLKATQQQQQEQLNSLQTRVDRIEKSTTLVIGHSVQVEAAYTQAEDSRDFKRLSKQAAEALGAELGQRSSCRTPCRRRVRSSGVLQRRGVRPRRLRRRGGRD